MITSGSWQMSGRRLDNDPRVCEDAGRAARNGALRRAPQQSATGVLADVAEMKRPQGAPGCASWGRSRSRRCRGE